MENPVSRRGFIRNAVLSSSIAAAVPAASAKQSVNANSNGMPTGKIGDLDVSRLISGGNLISGWSRPREWRA